MMQPGGGMGGMQQPQKPASMFDALTTAPVPAPTATGSFDFTNMGAAVPATEPAKPVGLGLFASDDLNNMMGDAAQGGGSDANPFAEEAPKTLKTTAFASLVP